MTLATTVGTYYNELKALRDTQQSQESAVDAASATLELQRVTTCVMMYRNLGTLMDRFGEPNTTVRIEDFYDMNYIRDGAAIPPDDAPVPPAP